MNTFNEGLAVLRAFHRHLLDGLTQTMLPAYPDVSGDDSVKSSNLALQALADANRVGRIRFQWYRDAAMVFIGQGEPSGSRSAKTTSKPSQGPSDPNFEKKQVQLRFVQAIVEKLTAQYGELTTTVTPRVLAELGLVDAARAVPGLERFAVAAAAVGASGATPPTLGPAFASLPTSLEYKVAEVMEAPRPSPDTGAPAHTAAVAAASRALVELCTFSRVSSVDTLQALFTVAAVQPPAPLLHAACQAAQRIPRSALMTPPRAVVANALALIWSADSAWWSPAPAPPQPPSPQLATALDWLQHAYDRMRRSVPLHPVLQSAGINACDLAHMRVRADLTEAMGKLGALAASAGGVQLTMGEEALALAVLARGLRVESARAVKAAEMAASVAATGSVEAADASPEADDAGSRRRPQRRAAARARKSLVAHMMEEEDEEGVVGGEAEEGAPGRSAEGSSASGDECDEGARKRTSRPGTSAAARGGDDPREVVDAEPGSSNFVIASSAPELPVSVPVPPLPAAPPVTAVPQTPRAGDGPVGDTPAAAAATAEAPSAASKQAKAPIPRVGLAPLRVCVLRVPYRCATAGVVAPLAKDLPSNVSGKKKLPALSRDKIMTALVLESMATAKRREEATAQAARERLARQSRAFTRDAAANDSASEYELEGGAGQDDDDDDEEDDEAAAAADEVAAMSSLPRAAALPVSAKSMKRAKRRSRGQETDEDIDKLFMKATFDPWTVKMDEELRKIVESSSEGMVPWKAAAVQLQRPKRDCIARWHTISNSNRRTWSHAEDETLRRLLKAGPDEENWADLTQHFVNRNAKQLRDRWHNFLRPELTRKKGWDVEEDRIIFTYARVNEPNHWADVASHLTGRSDNAVKNRFYSSIRRLRRRAAIVLGHHPMPTAGKAGKKGEIARGSKHDVEVLERAFKERKAGALSAESKVNMWGSDLMIAQLITKSNEPDPGVLHDLISKGGRATQYLKHRRDKGRAILGAVDGDHRTIASQAAGLIPTPRGPTGVRSLSAVVPTPPQGYAMPAPAPAPVPAPSASAAAAASASSASNPFAIPLPTVAEAPAPPAGSKRARPSAGMPASAISSGTSNMWPTAASAYQDSMPAKRPYVPQPNMMAGPTMRDFHAAALAATGVVPPPQGMPRFPSYLSDAQFASAAAAVSANMAAADQYRSMVMSSVAAAARAPGLAAVPSAPAPVPAPSGAPFPGVPPPTNRY